MYIIDKLKEKYPQYTENTEQYSKFLSRILSEEIKQKIFDDQKDFYRFIDAAYEAGVGSSLYSKNMCYFEMALNYDLDFLNYLYPDTKGMDVTDARKFILKECYNEEVEQRNKKKIGLI
jgi:hypothetical protein